MTFFNEFGKKWASEGSVEPISETQKKSGWDFLGSVPPISGQFNLVQQNTDEKINYLFNLINSFVISRGGTLNAVSTNALRDILNNLLMAVQGGHVGYATKDGMLLDTTQEERTIAEVLSDPVAENNGFYLWLSGEWVKQIGPWGLAMAATDASRIAAVEAAADADAAKTEAQTAAGLAVDAQADIHNNWQGKLDLAAQQAETATAQAGIATDKAAEASGSAATANAAKTAAELAKDAAMVGAVTYSDEATGRAAVADGDYFKVIGSGDVAAREYRRTNSTTSVLVAEYPSVGAVDAISEIITEEYTNDFAWTVRDSVGSVAVGVKKDGTVAAADLTVNSLNGRSAETIESAIDGSSSISVIEAPGVAFSVNDKSGRAALEVLDDGTVAAAEITIKKINGKEVEKAFTKADYGGLYAAELVYFNNVGQSLSEGSNGTITTVHEYDNLGFPARSSSPTATLPLTVANTEVAGRGESPMYGALGHIKELILNENGISYANQSYQLLACNNAYGGSGINYHTKASNNSYALAISQVNAGKSIAHTAGKTFMGGAIFWTQGENDREMSFATYRETLKQLSLDYNTDIKAITGQTQDVPLITYQVASMTSKEVALAQLAAANESPTIYMACPMYQFVYYDAQHINAASSQWLGGYYGLVYKRIVIDGGDWSPVQPISHVRQGSFVNVKFNVPVKPLVFDTSAVPAQANHGFTLVDASNNPIVITAVSLISPDAIKVTASGPIPDGAKLRYAFDGALAKGNLRDSQGDYMTYKGNKMHNWCVIFEYTL